MLDNPRNGNRRFYFTDSTAGLVEMAKGIANAMSPCVIMESSVEGGGTFTKPNRDYAIYFFVRASDMADGDAAAVAKEKAWFHARNFLTWLYQKREDEVARNIAGDFALIDLDNTMLDFTTVGPMENGWFGVLVQLERMEPLNLCVDEDLYIYCDEPCTDSDSDSSD